MNRQELIELIAENTGETKAATGRFLDAFINTVQTTIVKGDKVSLVGFGNFESVQTAARDGRNPATGESMKIPASIRPKFKPGSTFVTLVKDAADGKKKG